MSVQAESLRDQLQRVLRREVIAVLEAAEAPVRRVEIHRQCGTAADIEDTHKALTSLARDKQVEEVRDDSGVRAWRLVGDQRPAVAVAPKRRATAAKVPVLNLVINALEEAGEWLTVEQLEYRCHELSAEQIRRALYSAAMPGKRVIGRPRPGASNRAHEYGLPGWADPTTETGAAAAPEDSDVSKTQQLIDHIHRNPGVSAEGLKAATGITASHYLCAAVQAKAPKIGRIKHKDGGSWHYYPIGHEALDAAASPPPDSTPSAVEPKPDTSTKDGPAGFRAAIWSTGDLSVKTVRGELDLEPDEVEALLAYLIQTRGAVKAHFGGTGVRHD
ncbi:MAG: hypothetical protein RJQ08_08575 [Salinisphaeraceae bacterium]